MFKLHSFAERIWCVLFFCWLASYFIFLFTLLLLFFGFINSLYGWFFAVNVEHILPPPLLSLFECYSLSSWSSWQFYYFWLSYRRSLKCHVLLILDCCWFVLCFCFILIRSATNMTADIKQQSQIVLCLEPTRYGWWWWRRRRWRENHRWLLLFLYVFLLYFSWQIFCPPFVNGAFLRRSLMLQFYDGQNIRIALNESYTHTHIKTERIWRKRLCWFSKNFVQRLLDTHLILFWIG